MVRTSRKMREIVTANRPLTLRATGKMYPAGGYTGRNDEELIEGLSLVTCRRIATIILLPLRRRATGAAQAINVRPGETEAMRSSGRSWRLESRDHTCAVKQFGEDNGSK